MGDSERLKQVRGDLESLQSGLGHFQMGMPGTWHYPMSYRADDVPPVVEKSRMMEALTGRKVNMTVDMTDEDRSVIKKKLDVAEEASFDQWLLDQYRPWEHPAFKAYFLQKYPRFQEKMEEVIKKKAEFQLRAQVEALKDTPEGDMFRYEMTKHPELQDMLSTPLGPERSTALGQKAMLQEDFQRGMLNPWKLRRVDDMAHWAQYAGHEARPQLPDPSIRDDHYGTTAWGSAYSHFGGGPAPVARGGANRSPRALSGQADPGGFFDRRYGGAAAAVQALQPTAPPADAMLV